MPSTMPQARPDTAVSSRRYYGTVKSSVEISRAEAEGLRFRKNDAYPTSLMGRAKLWYYRYRLLTGTDMLTPWERAVFSTQLERAAAPLHFCRRADRRLPHPPPAKHLAQHPALPRHGLSSP